MKGSRFAAIVAGVLVVLGFPAASTPARGAGPEIVLLLATAGPGTVRITPAGEAPTAGCKTIAQEPEPPDDACIHHYASGTRVTLQAVPDKGRSFDGWSDFGCKQTSTRCTLNLTPGTRSVSAWFGPVSLQVLVNNKAEQPQDLHPFGLISVKPKPGRPCSLNDGERCEFPRGTVVTLTREFAAPGYFWIGACEGNRNGMLDATTCRLRLTSDETVGGGYTNPAGIPPPLGSGIAVVVAGRGRVTGSVVNGTQTLDCPGRCSISGLYRNDYVRLVATRSRFKRWSNGVPVTTQVVPMASVNRIQAIFGTG